MSGERILVTGGAGFIGSHLVEELLRRDYELMVVDNLDSFYSPAWKKANLAEIKENTGKSFQFVEADVCDEEAMWPLFHRFAPDCVIHLAALPGILTSITNPEACEKVNVGGTLNLLERCREFSVRKFVFASSSSIYGEGVMGITPEDWPYLAPISPYGASKLAGEKLCYVYSNLYGMTCLALRLFSVYGSRQRPDLVLHKFTALVEKGESLPVYGEGDSKRDYTHVSDVVTGIASAIDYIPAHGDGTPFEAFNLGSGRPISLQYLIAVLGETLGKAPRWMPGRTKPGDVAMTCSNSDKAERLLQYKAVIPIELGIQKFVEWYRANPDRRL